QMLLRRLTQLTAHPWFAALVVVISVMLTAVGCQSSSAVSTGPSPVKCQVTLATSSIAANGGSGTVNVTTEQECAWSASTQAGWISSLAPTSGQGNGQISSTAAPKPQRAERQGEIVVNDARVEVRQEPATCQFTLTSTNHDFSQ